MQKFTIHWSQVSDGGGLTLFALWPSPMNDDVCFRQAGFTDFGDGDEQWDSHADDLLSRLLDQLSKFGTPRLTSMPIERQQSLFRRLLGSSELLPLTLREQIEARTVYDEFPDCVVEFGQTGVTLRTGDGHHIFWIAMPHSKTTPFMEALPKIHGQHPLVRTDLKWESLRPQI